MTRKSHWPFASEEATTIKRVYNGKYRYIYKTVKIY